MGQAQMLEKKGNKKKNYIHEEGKYMECFTSQFLPFPFSLYNICKS
jgi:hypothetical protein